MSPTGGVLWRTWRRSDVLSGSVVIGCEGQPPHRRSVPTAMGTEFVGNEIVMIVVLVLMTAVGAVVGWWLR